MHTYFSICLENQSKIIHKVLRVNRHILELTTWYKRNNGHYVTWFSVSYNITHFFLILAEFRTHQLEKFMFSIDMVNILKPVT